MSVVSPGQQAPFWYWMQISGQKQKMARQKQNQWTYFCGCVCRPRRLSRREQSYLTHGFQFPAQPGDPMALGPGRGAWWRQ